jgi:arylformamidase
VFADAEILLIGVESQSVGPLDSPMIVHKILLSKNIVLLEGIVLDNAIEGRYFLNCAPLNIEGIEGSPCRAVLIEA